MRRPGRRGFSPTAESVRQSVLRLEGVAARWTQHNVALQMAAKPLPEDNVNTVYWRARLSTGHRYCPTEFSLLRLNLFPTDPELRPEFVDPRRWARVGRRSGQTLASAFQFWRDN